MFPPLQISARQFVAPSIRMQDDEELLENPATKEELEGADSEDELELDAGLDGDDAAPDAGGGGGDDFGEDAAA